MVKVLVIDDSERLREVFFEYFKILDFQTFLAEDGQKGLEEYEKCKPDIIIVDMIMPVMGGRDFILNLRKLPHASKTPIIIISAYVSVHELMDVLKAGANYFMKKPIVFDELKAQIELALKYSRS